jgi:hypothetical protein
MKLSLFIPALFLFFLIVSMIDEDVSS